MNRSSLAQALLAAGLLLASTITAAQGDDYPNRPVTVVVPVAPGGGLDVMARLLTDRLTKRLKQPFIVDNRPGASSTIGTEHVARASGDGYTLLFTGSPHTLNPYLFNLRFDPRKDLVPVSHVVNTYQLLVAHPSTGFESVSELLRAAKAQPDHYTYGSGGSASPSHVAGVVFAKMAGVQLRHIPYKGSGPAMNDLLGGQIDLLFSSLPSAVAQMGAGRVVPLGISSPQATPLAPGVEPISNTVPNYMQLTWFGVVAPEGTPLAVREQLSSAISEIVHSPEMKEALIKHGMEPVGDGPAAFGQLLEDEFEFWNDFLRDTPIKIE